MTTAARPTFDPARGGSGKGEKDLSALSKQYSSRDLPGHTKLKYREHGQGTSDELRQRDFRKELEEREAKASGSGVRQAGVRRAIEANSAPSKKPKVDHVSTANLDQDDPIDDDSSSSEDDSDDDTAALLEELNKIKRERAQEAEKKEQDKKQEEERIRMENILSGNPLLNYSSGKAGPSDMKVKRRWDQDVVFKNCARTEPDKKGPIFVNDSLRSEFHKKFMEKYIK
ncbi:protein CWC15 homolog [Contarinia nasturtii]|uniref:protein CWC15 homolog n=1 Tax=Contarinia nasturtii TaxID=265458 RepID=UPI0012D423BD|nr:protein CWC15 homolog [Contarinia nasturtii]